MSACRALALIVEDRRGEVKAQGKSGERVIGARENGAMRGPSYMTWVKAGETSK